MYTKDKYISFIIPAHNCSKTIGRTIKSITKMNLPKYEIVIIENGSTDNTLKKIEEISKTNSNIIIGKSSKGVSNARNKGIEMAKGEIIAFIDADDYFDQKCKKALMSFNGDKYDLSIHGRKRILINGAVENYATESDDIISTKELAENYANYFKKNIYSSIIGKIFKSSIINKNNIRFKNVDTYEDLIFVLEYLTHSDKVRYSSETIATSVELEESLSKETKKNNYEKQISIIMQQLDANYAKLNITNKKFINSQKMYLLSLLNRNSIKLFNKCTPIHDVYLNNAAKIKLRDSDIKSYIYAVLIRLKLYRIITIMESKLHVQPR